MAKEYRNISRLTINGKKLHASPIIQIAVRLSECSQNLWYESRKYSVIKRRP
jgi:hypothetical protein